MQLGALKLRVALLQVAVMLPVWPAVESLTVTLPLCANAGIEKEHAPLEVVAAAHALVVEVQLVPDSDTAPLVQVAVAVPEKPEAVLVAVPVVPCVSAPKE